MFQEVFFPTGEEEGNKKGGAFALRKITRYTPASQLDIRSAPLVFFDLETTGLEAEQDEIVEIGSQKYQDGVLIAEWSTFVCPSQPIPAQATKISGITQDMLEGQPSIESVLPIFLTFIEGAVLVAHNAVFDMGFIREAARLQGIDLQWPSLCTLKMARSLLPNLERKNLDTLAQHYGLTFEARHRSIGDVKVTAEVFSRLLEAEAASLETWQDFAEFSV